MKYERPIEMKVCFPYPVFSFSAFATESLKLLFSTWNESEGDIIFKLEFSICGKQGTCIHNIPWAWLWSLSRMCGYVDVSLDLRVTGAEVYVCVTVGIYTKLDIEHQVMMWNVAKQKWLCCVQEQIYSIHWDYLWINYFVKNLPKTQLNLTGSGWYGNWREPWAGSFVSSSYRHSVLFPEDCYLHCRTCIQDRYEWIFLLKIFGKWPELAQNFGRIISSVFL